MKALSIPQLSLLFFATWTLLVLMFTVGISRWEQVLLRGARLNEFPGDVPHGSPRYRRATRAHANCVENLPVFGALVYLLSVTGTSGPWVDGMAIAIAVARVGQTTTHVAVVESHRSVALRFSFFFLQLCCMFGLGTLMALR